MRPDNKEPLLLPLPLPLPLPLLQTPLLLLFVRGEKLV